MCRDCVGDRLTRRRFLRLAGGAGMVLAASGGRISAGSPPSVAPVTVADGLEIFPREAWADAAPTGPIEPDDPRFLLVHHTAGPTPAPEAVVDELRGIYRFHTGAEKGWPDVAYHFFVDPYGGVWEGRAGSLDGAVEASATGGNQGFAQLVCLLGDFTSQMPTVEAHDALVRTLVWLGRRYSIDLSPGATVQFESRGSNKWPAGELVTAASVSGHRDMSATACPGDTFYPYLVGDFRKAVAQYAIATAPTITASPTTAPLAATSTAAAVAETPTSSESVAVSTSPSATTTPAPIPTDVDKTASTEAMPAPTDGQEDSATPWLIGGGIAAAAAAAAGVATRRRDQT